MIGYIVRRLLALVPTLLIVLFLVTVMVRLIPGDIIDVMLKDQRTTDPIDREALARRLGINQPLYVKYGQYVWNAARGDLGASLWSQQAVRNMIWSRLPVSMELALLSLTISTVVAVMIGVISAVRQDTVLDYALRGIAVLALSVPNFAVGTLIIVLPAIYFGWTPPLFYKPLTQDLWANLGQFMIPAAVLGLAISGSLMRLTRTMMLEVLREDYIRTAWAKGLSERVVLTRHALRNALIPLVTLLGLQVAFVLSGSVIMEQIFNLPGMGRLLIDSISVRDYPVVQGITVVVGTWVVTINLLIDVSYAYLDPRVKVGGGM